MSLVLLGDSFSVADQGKSAQTHWAILEKMGVFLREFYWRFFFLLRLPVLLKGLGDGQEGPHVLSIPHPHPCLCRIHNHRMGPGFKDFLPPSSFLPCTPHVLFPDASQPYQMYSLYSI